MAISIFPSTAAEFVSNNFVVDMNDTSNNTADTGGVKQAGPYSMSFSSGDTSFDVYFVDEEGNAVGYSNTTSIIATGLFTTVVIFGVAQDEVISFLYQGSVNNADGEGDEPGAGAYLESISPTDLPSIDDTATVIGGNFGADTEITFESGATVLPAKSITVVSGTELLVTRPDGLIEDDSPYDLKAINTGVTPPSSVDFVLTDAVTAGSDPTWVTTSPLTTGNIGTAYNETLEATDSDGTVVDYSVTAGALPTGLSLNSSTGVISGTPTASGQTFTVTATDDGGNQTSREFSLAVIAATGGTITTAGGFVYHTFTSTDDFVALAEITDAEYLIVAGGGGGGFGNGGGGGAGGLLNGTSTISPGTIPVTIGAGGAAEGGAGSNTVFTGIDTAIGGGFGGANNENGGDGGSGGGAGQSSGFGETLGGSGTSGQGNDGGNGADGLFAGGGGGGAGATGERGDNQNGGDGGVGLNFSDFATATSTGDNGFYAGGGAGAGGNSTGIGGAGQGSNTGGGGDDGLPGNDGILIVRYG